MNETILIQIILLHLLHFLGPYLQPGETGAIIVSGGQIISGGGRNRQYLKTVEVLRQDGSPWCTLPDMEFARYECLLPTTINVL